MRRKLRNAVWLNPTGICMVKKTSPTLFFFLIFSCSGVTETQLPSVSVKSENGICVLVAFQLLAGCHTDSQQELKTHCVLFAQLILEVTGRGPLSFSQSRRKWLAISFPAGGKLEFGCGSA